MLSGLSIIPIDSQLNIDSKLATTVELSIVLSTEDSSKKEAAGSS